MSLAGVASTFVALGSRVASSETPLQQTQGILWVMIGIGAAGAIVTFSFLVYALLRFRDPNTRGRRYG